MFSNELMVFVQNVSRLQHIDVFEPVIIEAFDMNHHAIINHENSPLFKTDVVKACLGVMISCWAVSTLPGIHCIELDLLSVQLPICLVTKLPVAWCILDLLNVFVVYFFIS